MHDRGSPSATVEPPPSNAAHPLLPGSGGVGPRWIWMMVLRRWPLMATVVVSSLVLAFGWLSLVTPLYTATTQILLDTRKHRLMPGQEFVTDSGVDANSIATEVALIRSFAVAARVIERHDLDMRSDFMVVETGRLARWPRELLGDLFGASDAASSSIEALPARRQAGDGQWTPDRLSAVRAVQAGTAVRRVATTYFLEISFTHQSPPMAALIANAVSDAYLNEVLEAKYQVAQRSTTWLGERVTQLGQQVQTAERAVAEHRARHGLLSVRPASLGEQQAGEINAQLVMARAQVVEKKGKYDQARGILDSGRIESMAEVMASPVILSLRNAEATAAREEADLLTRYGPEHPSIIKTRAQRMDLRRQVAAELSRVVGSLRTDYELTLARERSLERSLGEMQSDSQPVIRLRELEREANASKALYETLLSRMKEAEQQSGAPTMESRVIAPALLPSAPTYPSRQGVLILALFGGFGLGIGLSFMLDHIENGLLTIEQAEQVLQLPVLAMVEQLGDKDRQVDGHLVPIPEVVWRKPLSRFGESIRSIRVSTQMSDADAPPRLVLVTSSLPSEGKTTIVQSMAYSAANSGRVLLMDCDLRHPSTTSMFKLDGGPGLTDLLAGQAEPHEVLMPGPVPNLTILPAGSTARHPPDILGSEKLASLLQTLRNSYDLVLIDAPPVNLVVDSALLSRRVDKIVFVVRWRTTPHDVVVRTLASLDRPRQKIVGIVLNGVRLQKLAGYTRNYAYYGKNYDKYYTQ